MTTCKVIEARRYSAWFNEYYRFVFTFYVPEIKKAFTVGGSADKIYRLKIGSVMSLGDLLSDDQISRLLDSEEDVVDFTEDE